MKILYRKLLNEIDRVNPYESVYYTLDIDDKDLSIILLCLMYHNGLLTRKQISKYFLKYTDGSVLSRKINTYHSKISNKWYNDVSFTYILFDTCMNHCTDTEVSIPRMIEILNIGFNKNHNWCLNYLTFNILHRIIGYAYDNDNYTILKWFKLNLNLVSYEEADEHYDLSCGYCCSDCDGCLGEYKRSRYRMYYKNDDKSVIIQKLNSELIKFRKHLRNPNDKFV